MAGATGATGRVLMRLAGERGLSVTPHVRVQRAAGGVPFPDAAVCDLTDADALDRAMAGVTTVVQLIGTTKKRFARGDTYESSDVGTTACLAASAARVGADHFVLLSSVGAGRPFGAYLHAKACAEAIVRDAGVPYTIFRPSMFEGAGHRGIPGARAFTTLFGLDRYRPIVVEDLARALLVVACERAPLGAVVEGRSLLELVARAG